MLLLTYKERTRGRDASLSAAYQDLFSSPHVYAHLIYVWMYLGIEQRLACIASHTASSSDVPASPAHASTKCDYCTRACERRPPSVHTTTPSSHPSSPSFVSACVRMHLPSSVLRAGCSSNSRRRCLIKPTGSLCSGALITSQNPGFGDQLHSPLGRTAACLAR